MFKEDILKRLDEIMENVQYASSLDIQIHVDVESHPTISYQVDEVVVIKDSK